MSRLNRRRSVVKVVDHLEKRDIVSLYFNFVELLLGRIERYPPMLAHQLHS